MAWILFLSGVDEFVHGRNNNKSQYSGERQSEDNGHNQGIPENRTVTAEVELWFQFTE